MGAAATAACAPGRGTAALSRGGAGWLPAPPRRSPWASPAGGRGPRQPPPAAAPPPRPGGHPRSPPPTPPPAVVALVHDDGLAVGLGEEVALEIGVAEVGGVGHVDVGHPTLRGLGDLAQVALDPVAVAQRLLILDRHHLDDA